MRKIITVLLLVGNIISIPFYHNAQHTRDNFALCGSSYNENKRVNDDQTVNIVEFRRYQSKENQSKDLLKEISLEINEDFILFWFDGSMNRNHTNSYLLSMETIKVDNLSTNLIFKPS